MKIKFAKQWDVVSQLWKKFYPITITSAVVDADRGQRMNATLADLYTNKASVSALAGKADKVSNPTSGNFAGLDTNGNLTDSGLSSSDFNGSLALAMLMPKIDDSTYSTTTMVTNPEFYTVITDSEDKIISGVRKDGSYVGLPYLEAVEAIVGIIDDIDNP